MVLVHKGKSAHLQRAKVRKNNPNNMDHMPNESGNTIYCGKSCKKVNVN